jgi:multiple sugar transport system permease protein
MITQPGLASSTGAKTSTNRSTVAVPARRKPSRGRTIRRRLRILAVLLIGLVLALPLFYLLSASLMSDSQLTTYPPALVPSHLHFNNYSAAWSYLTPRSVLNSVIFTAGVVGLQWALCISGGLVLAKMRFRLRKVFIAIYGITFFVPFITVLVPTFIVTDKLHLINSYAGLIVPVVAQTAFGTLLFRQFILYMPEGLIDAAKVDGAGWWTVLGRIIVPLSKPITGAYVAISVLTAWNMYVWPLIATSKTSLQVLTEALAPLASSEYATVPQTVGMAASVIATVPMLIAFLLAQRAFVRGFAGTGLE